MRGLSSPFGAWLDGLLDRIAELVLCLALGVALEHQSDDPHAYLYSFVAFASLAMTHIATLMNATAFGKGQLAESAGRGLVGRLAGFVRIPPLKLRNYLRSGIDVYLLVFALGAVFDHLMGVVYYFAVVQNLYWLAIVSMVIRQKSNWRYLMEPSSSAEMLAVLGSIKESFFRVLPKLAISLVVLCVGWLVAWSLRALARRVVARFSKRIAVGTTQAAWQQALADKEPGASSQAASTGSSCWSRSW